MTATDAIMVLTNREAANRRVGAVCLVAEVANLMAEAVNRALTETANQALAGAINQAPIETANRALAEAVNCGVGAANRQAEAANLIAKPVYREAGARVIPALV
ncbi:MAG: hypothetical protein LBU61_06820 [Coriobacteriales bacterium]|nr:hypothetical protein [Coriobacteriales bacterium]